MKQALAQGTTTILKDNISWHYPFPAREHDAVADGGHHPGPQAARASPTSRCVQNKTVVTNAFKGEDLNHYVPLFKKYDDPRPLQLQGDGHEVGRVPAEGEDARPRPASSPTASRSPTTSSARTSSTCRR